MRIPVSSKQIIRLLILITLALLAANVLCMANWHLGGIRNKYTILPLQFFDLSTDTSIPTWFSAFILACNSIMLGILALHARRRKQKWTAHWAILSVTFLVLSIDEVAAMHERLGGLAKGLLVSEEMQASAWLHYGWVVGGAAIVLIFVVAYLPFLIFELSSYFRLVFITSAACFVGGAIGVEVFNSRLSATEGSWNLQYAMQTTLEEGLEMFGASLFAYALAQLIEHRIGTIALQLGGECPTTIDGDQSRVTKP